ncbi:YciI family protein [Rhodanobacter ginsengisoli]|uniref:YciI family protein n=1 Tax=Rhodanobacter ginsengisoli TaxID=418646 RepID=A0ABW0QPF6_9GAMM
MKYLVMIYCDDALLDALPAGEFDTLMHGCFMHADALRAQGQLHDSQQLEAPSTARTLRMRNGQVSVVDGPFAETKEYLGGFNLIEAENMDEAVRIASAFPWSRTGAIEIRPLRELSVVRQRVGA